MAPEPVLVPRGATVAGGAVPAHAANLPLRIGGFSGGGLARVWAARTRLRTGPADARAGGLTGTGAGGRGLGPEPPA